METKSEKSLSAIKKEEIKAAVKAKKVKINIR